MSLLRATFLNTFLMPSSFFAMLRELYESIEAPKYIQPMGEPLGFPIHPSASEIAEQILVDPDVLKNETYEPGIYDESGDYYPQYTDDPSKLPDGFEPVAPPVTGEDTVPESLPASELASSDEFNSAKE